MKAVYLLIGIGLLMLGHRLFWLFVGSVGFIAGFTYAQEFLAIQSSMATALIAIGAGVIGALVSIFMQGFAIGIAGFLAGTYILYVILSFFGLQANGVLWLVYMAGGAAGTVCMFMIFDWALIVLSSLTGAAVIVDTMQINVPVEVIIFVVLVIAGIVFQARLTGKR